MNHFSNYLLTKFYKATYEYQYDAELNIFKEKVIEYAGMSLDEFSLHYMKVNAKYEKRVTVLFGLSLMLMFSIVFGIR